MLAFSWKKILLYTFCLSLLLPEEKISVFILIIFIFWEKIANSFVLFFIPQYKFRSFSFIFIETMTKNSSEMQQPGDQIVKTANTEGKFQKWKLSELLKKLDLFCFYSCIKIIFNNATTAEDFTLRKVPSTWSPEFIEFKVSDNYLVQV